MVLMREDGASVHAGIISRIAAILLTAFSLAAVGTAVDKEDRHALDTYHTVEELRAYVESFLIESYWAWFGIAIVVGFGYVALVEGTAFVLRVVWRRVNRPS